MIHVMKSFLCIYVPTTEVEVGHIILGLDPVSIGIYVGMTVTCVYDISCISWQIVIKLAWIFNLNGSIYCDV